MTLKRDIVLTFIFSLLSTTCLFSQKQASTFVQTDNKTSPDNSAIINDSAIVLPESLNDSIDVLLRKWQVDFSQSEDICTEGPNETFSDSVYMQRLYNLPTEMELSFNPIVRSYIEMYSKRRRSLVSYMLSLGNYYYPMFEQALDRHGLPLELKYLPVIESALNPTAVSRMGATGLWQFMIRTGKQYNLAVNSLVDERRDPYKSTEAAARFLKDLYKIYGDWNLVIAAYNCGPGNVNKAIARSGGKRDYWAIYYRLPRETRGYVPAFIAANYIMNYSDEHHICPKQASSSEYMYLDTVQISEQVHFKQISSVLDIPLEDVRRYNPQFKRDIIPGNENKLYTLVLPTKFMYSYINKDDEIKNYNRAIYLTHRKQTLTNQYGMTATDGNVVNHYYKVKKGDTLGAIARRNRTTVSRLKRMNGMRSTKLSIGRRLIVRQTVKPVEVREELASGGEVKNTYYRIKRGDTLGALARQHKTTVAQLKRMNNMNSSRLSIGRKIVVRQEKIAPKPKEKVEKSEVDKVLDRKQYPKIKPSSAINSHVIITDYLRKINQDEEQNDDLELVIIR